MPKPLCMQSQEFVVNLINYFERERDHGSSLIPITAVRERVADALGLHVATVNKISQTIKLNQPLQSPKRTKTRAKPVRDIDSFDESAIRNVIYEMHQKRVPVSRQSLLKTLQERDIFKGRKSTLGKILNDLGFRFIKDNVQRGLMELNDVASKRIKFLREYMKNLNSNDPLQCVYLDETWIFQNGTITRSWHDKNLKSLRTTKTDGKRSIILHAGNTNGFIVGASLIFSSRSNKADYHGEMNKDNFLHWFEEQLLKNLEEPSLIILDNASYHKVLENKSPNTSSNKTEIKEWLQKQNIVFEDNLFKPELLTLVKQNKPKNSYVVETLAAKYGHQILFLPPYHSIFNPIENIWGISKSYYNKNVGRNGYRMENSLQLWKEALSTITPEIWHNCIRHANNIIKEYWEKEAKFDWEEIQPLIINLNEESSSEEIGSD